MPERAETREPNSAPTAEADALAPAAIRTQLQRIVSAPEFVDSERLREFLRFVVEETLTGKSTQIKGYSVGRAVFARGEDFDPQADTIVRVEAGRLRRKLAEYYRGDGQHDPILIDIPKGSYIPVFQALSVKPEAVAARPQSTPPAPASANPARHRMTVVATAAVTVLVVVATLLFWLWRDDAAVDGASDIETGLTAITRDKPVLVVRPFDDLSHDSEYGYLSAGIVEDIIIELSKISGLQVMIQRQPAPPRGESGIEPLSLPGISHTLEGSILIVDDQVRITTHLIDAVTRIQIWGERYDRPLSDVFTLQSELAAQVVQALAVELSVAEEAYLRQQPPRNLEAYRLYLQARPMGNPPTDHNRLTAAQALYEQVIELDPEFAGGYAGLAYVHALRALFSRSQITETDLQTALDLAQKAIAVDANFGWAYSSQAIVLMQQSKHDEGIAAGLRAVEKQPNDAYAHAYLGMVLLGAGRVEEALAVIKKALQLDPDDPRTPFLNMLSMCYFHRGQYQQAVALIERNNARGGPTGPHMATYLAAAYAENGQTEKALAAVRALQHDNSDFPTEVWLRRVFIDSAEVERVLAGLRKARLLAKNSD